MWLAFEIKNKSNCKELEFRLGFFAEVLYSLCMEGKKRSSPGHKGKGGYLPLISMRLFREFRK